MRTIDTIQGSPDWLAVRLQHFTASEAPAMMGASKYTTRNELLRQKATGIVDEVDSAKQRLFDRGHAAEEAARPIVEAGIGQELYPVTGTVEIDGLRLLASFDGLTMLEDVVWENKLYSASLAEQVAYKDLEPHYYWQLEQQLLVSGAEKAYFTASDGTPENTVGMWYESLPERRAALIAGWKQFKADLDAYQHVEKAPEAVAQPIEALPYLSISIVGEVRESNIALYRSRALDFIAAIKTDLVTDEDFAQAEANVKFCDEAEKKIKAVKEAAIGQTASIDELFRTLDLLAEQMRSKRLSLEKLVKAKKDTRRAEIVATAQDTLNAYIESINQRLETVRMPAIPGGFAEAMKGKKTLSGCKDAVDDALAAAKIKADQTAVMIERNLVTISRFAEHDFLFSDRASLIGKPPEDLQATIDARIAKHREAENAKIEAEREKVRREEQAKAEAAEKERQRVEQERIAAEQAEERRKKAEQEQAEAIESARKLRENIAPTVVQIAQEQDFEAQILAYFRTFSNDQKKLVLHFVERIAEHREAA